MLYRFVFGTIPPALRQECYWLKGGEGVPIPSHPNDELRSLLAQLLKYEPDERISMSQVCVHPFFLTMSTGGSGGGSSDRKVRMKDALPSCCCYTQGACLFF